MICIKCGANFTSTRGNVVCGACKEEHISTLGYLVGNSNITKTDAEKWKSELEKQLAAVNMLIDGKPLSEISKFMGTTNQATSLMFSRKISKAAGQIYGLQGKHTTKGLVKKIDYALSWPENLYCAVFRMKEYSDMPPDAVESCEYVLTTLTEREADVLKKRFIDELTLNEIGPDYGVTKERIRQIECKALRKLRHPSRAKYLKAGVLVQNAIDEAEKDAIEQEKQRRKAEALRQYQETMRAKAEQKANLSEISIGEMNLNVRSFNCLARAGINTLEDLSEMNIGELMKIRNLGKKSAEEIINRCSDFGLILPQSE